MTVSTFLSPLSSPVHGVVCLCAQWCSTCRAYRSVFEALALQYPELHFIWLDVEEAAAVADEYEVETFPTLLLAHASGAHFLGPVAAQAQVLERLLQCWDEGAPPLEDPQAQALWARIGAAYAAGQLHRVHCQSRV